MTPGPAIFHAAAREHDALARRRRQIARDCSRLGREDLAAESRRLARFWKRAADDDRRLAAAIAAEEPPTTPANRVRHEKRM